MSMLRLSVACACVFVWACGSSSEPAKAPQGKPGEQGHHEGHGDHHHEGHGQHGGHGHAVEGGTKAFHDVLAPAYHMDKGAPRLDKACAGVPSMQAAHQTLSGESKGDAAKWKAVVDALGASVGALDKACQAAGKPDVDAKLEAVHDAFHAVMELGR
jgi:hypothetical protein